MTQQADVFYHKVTVCTARRVAERWRSATTIQKYFRGWVTRSKIIAQRYCDWSETKPTEPPVGRRIKDDSDVIKMLREHIDILGRLREQDEKDWIFTQEMDQAEIDSKSEQIKQLNQKVKELQEQLEHARQLAYESAKDAIILRRMIMSEGYDIGSDE